MQNKQITSRCIMVFLVSSLVLIPLFGCGPKSDYSDTNSPEKPQTTGAVGDNGQPHVPHGQGRHVGTMPVPALPKQGP
jgi:hypothetical protein